MEQSSENTQAPKQKKLTQRQLINKYNQVEKKAREIEIKGKEKAKELEKLRADYKAQKQKMLDLETQHKELFGTDLKGF